jgi:single-strand DNA-binding protein
MNSIIISGNLTKDVELNTTNSGISVGKFTVAVNSNFKKEDGSRDVYFMNVVTWKERAEVCSKYLAKGSKVIVKGEIQTRSYEKNDGTKAYTWEIQADAVEFVGTKKEIKKDEEIKAEPIEDEGLPF